MANAQTNARTKKRDRKNVPAGVAHVTSTFNNTIVTIADVNGNTIAWSSSGQQGFKGSRKGTPFAAQLAGEAAAKGAKEHGVRVVDVQLKGAGSGRESALRATQSQGIEVISIKDVTPMPHNGTKLPKRRRV